ncbi:MAG: hypothetical protein JNJ54_28155 [Myxococcaceae bacterium]|nr:hypothetical protein [Myxococcaceae bacterium]
MNEVSEPREIFGADQQPWVFARLYAAWKQAAKGKRRRPDVAGYEARLGERLAELSERLEAGAWRPGGYRTFERVERGKRRLIAAAPFEDRIVHHALVKVGHAAVLPESDRSEFCEQVHQRHLERAEDARPHRPAHAQM